MTACDFTVALRIVAADGVTVRVDLNDQANGLILMSPVLLPQDDVDWETYRSPRAHGDFTHGPPRDMPGELVATVDVTGSTWAQVETRWDGVRDHLRAEWEFFVEYEAEGVTRSWRTRRPNVTVPSHTPAELKTNRLTYQVRFTCQPNPTVTIA